MTRDSIIPFSALVALITCGLTSGHSQTAGLRSVTEDVRPIKVAFSNETTGSVVAHWIDEQGIAQEIGTIFPNQVVEVTTFPGHVTAFSSGGNRISTFRATAFSNGATFGIVGAGPSIDTQPPQAIGCTFLPDEIAVCTFPPPGVPENLPPEVIVCMTMPGNPPGTVPPGLICKLSPPPAITGKPGGTTSPTPPVATPKPVVPKTPVAQGNPPVTVQDIGAVIRFIIQNL